MVVFLGEEVAEDTSGVCTADLIGRQAEVNALDKVPELGHKILIELPEERRQTRKNHSLINVQQYAAVSARLNLYMCFCLSDMSPFHL